MFLHDEVLESVEHLALRPEDGAAVALAVAYADAIDAAVAGDDPYARTKALYLGPHLLKTLGELGATPAGRAAMAAKVAVPAKAAEVAEGEQKKGTVTQLRSLRAGVSR